MLKKDYETRTGNDRFEGFCMDLMKTLSERIGFKYRIQLVKDNNYGARQPDGSFNGMFKELINMVMLSLRLSYVLSYDFSGLLRLSLLLLLRCSRNLLHYPKKKNSVTTIKRFREVRAAERRAYREFNHWKQQQLHHTHNAAPTL